MKSIKTLALLIVTISLISCGNQISNKKSLDTEIDSVSYALGLNMAMQLKSNFKEGNTALFVQGYMNGMDSLNLLIDRKDLGVVLNTYFKKKQQEAGAKKTEIEFAVVKKEGEDFLAKNKTKKGVITTESGLQYIVLKEGKGAKPLVTSRVKVHYHGTLIDGTVFDSSVLKKTPYTTLVTEVIQGWVEGLQLMNEGAKYKFFVPQNLGYGATPRAGIIKPFMALIFEVELLQIIQK
ncbi:MAG: FKBP-type peptidyl-prolyl cis-trans isomerase [Flavobacteriaceae bacterium]|nr:FKBP-type peptidyl-prolyl cis-trans isomerase [Flavobacteriaceae bacterium]